MVSVSVLKKIVKLEWSRPGRLEQIPRVFDIFSLQLAWTRDLASIRLALRLGFTLRLRRDNDETGERTFYLLSRDQPDLPYKITVRDPSLREKTTVRARVFDSIVVDFEEADEGRHVNSQIDGG